MYKGIMKKKNIYFDELSSTKFFNPIEEKRIKVLKTLKSDHRSTVKLIELNGKTYVYKIPTEKNTRKWQRFLSIFRGGESQREFLCLEKILKNGIDTAKPYFACETKKFGMVVDSYLVMEYIDGREGNIDNIEIICDTLEKIHSKGFIHGDSQLSNFVISNGFCYIIDARFKKSIFGKFAQAYEFIYLETSCGQSIKKYYKRHGIYHVVARLVDYYLIFWGKVRAFVKSLLKGEKFKKSEDLESKESIFQKIKSKFTRNKDFEKYSSEINNENQEENQ